MSGWTAIERPKDLPKPRQLAAEEAAKKLGCSVEQVKRMRQGTYTPRSPDEIMKQLRDKANGPEGRVQLAEFEEMSHRGYVGIIGELLKQGKITKDDLRKLIEKVEAAPA